MGGMFARKHEVGINDKRSGLISFTGKPSLYGFNQTDVFDHCAIEVSMVENKLSPGHGLLAKYCQLVNVRRILVWFIDR